MHPPNREDRRIKGTDRDSHAPHPILYQLTDIARYRNTAVKLEVFSTRRLNRAKALSSFRLVEVALALVWPSALIPV
jgi:hypothetical protein